MTSTVSSICWYSIDAKRWCSNSCSDSITKYTGSDTCELLYQILWVIGWLILKWEVDLPLPLGTGHNCLARIFSFVFWDEIENFCLLVSCSEMSTIIEIKTLLENWLSSEKNEDNSHENSRDREFSLVFVRRRLIKRSGASSVAEFNDFVVI